MPYDSALTYNLQHSMREFIQRVATLPPAEQEALFDEQLTRLRARDHSLTVTVTNRKPPHVTVG